MSDPYLPAQDALALQWLTTFAQKLTLSPATYFVTAADALAVTNAVNLYASALAVAVDPESRTPVSVAAKDDARTSAEQICRQFVNLIKYNAGISDPDKIAAGVRPVNPSREPIDAPATSPLLNVVAATPGSQTLRYADSMTPDSPAKPFGATDLLLFCAVAESVVLDPADAKFVGKFTRNPVSVGFQAADNGKQATYFAQWANRKGQTGPWSSPVTLAIAA